MTTPLVHAQVKNVLGVPFFDGALGQITLLCGGNFAGKTSLLEAIKFGLTAQMPRVAQVKELGEVVADGQKHGSVALTWDTGEHLIRTLPERKVDGAPPAGWDPRLLAYTLNAERFARLQPAERRAFLFAITGAEASPAWVKERLAKEAGLPAVVVDSCAALVGSGFDAAARACADKASEYRGHWQAITGERYGAVKAKDWTAPAKDAGEPVAPLREALTAAEREGDALTAALSLAQRRAGLGDLGGEQTKLDALRERIGKGEAKLTEQRAALEALPTAAPKECPCPHCGGALRVEGGQIVAGDAGGPSVDPAVLAEQRAGLKEAIGTTERGLAKLRTDAEGISNRLAQAAALALEDATDTRSVADLQTALDDARREANALRGRISVSERAADDAKKAQEATPKAKAAHDLVQAWERAKALMEPDGLPAELLARALGPFRRALADRPGSWREVTIGDDMEIRIGGRRYALCSESEQWRADAVCASAVASITGTPLIVLDRFDMIEVADRGATIGWLASLPQQVIFAGTLKVAPALDGITVHWLEKLEVAA